MNPFQNIIEKKTTGSRQFVAFSQPGLSRKRVISYPIGAKRGFHEGELKQLEMTGREENVVRP